MGLLDFNDPNLRLGLGLLAAGGPSAVPQSTGQRLFGLLGQLGAEQRAEEERKQRAAMQALQMDLVRSQIGETQAQAKQREAAAQEAARKAAEAQRLQGLLRNAVSPTQPIEANAASGVTGPRPEALAPVGQRRPVDFQSLIAQGVPPDLVKALAESANYGAPEVARTVDTVDEQGRPATRQFDKFGRPVGDPLRQWKAPERIDAGGWIGMLDPVSTQLLKQFQKTNTPDAVLSAQTTMRGQNMTDARARDANSIASAGNVIKAETDLRKEFADLPEVKNYKTALPAYNAIVDASSRNTPQADINLVYGLAKLYDPTSVVREGEYATIASSQSIPEWLKGQAQRLTGGGRLTSATKAQILQEAQGRIGSYESEFSGARSTYERVAGQRGADPKSVFTPVGVSKAVPPPKPAMPRPGDVIDGYRFRGGDPADKRNWERQ